MTGTANTVLKTILSEVGLNSWPPIARDKLFWLAVAGAVPVWITLWYVAAPLYSIQDRSLMTIALTSIIYYPLLEEILFRGVIQGRLFSKSWGNRKFINFSAANWITSLLFVSAHLWYQPMLWAIMIIVPSLVYGLFRDRYLNIYPSILLHAFYNAGFVLVNAMVQ